MQDFKKLDVWRKSHELVVLIYRAIPTGSERRYPGLGAQLRRSASSVPANIVEGCGHSSEREFARFLQMAVASANEVLYHLLLARDLGMLQSAAFARLEARGEQVKKMLVGLLRHVRTAPTRPSQTSSPPSANR